MRARVIAALTAATVVGAAAGGYAYSTYAKWSSMPVTFFVNGNNADLSSAAATTAIQVAMSVWSGAGTTFRYQYGGSASDTATAYDNRNVVFFRNTTNGANIATTYSWWDSNNRLLDSDIIVWDANFRFFTGTSGCGGVSNAAYLEDVITHELGHALGMNHSASTDATMYPSYGYCSQSFRTLANDDINGLKSLYPAAAPTNTAPTVTITSPANGATIVIGSTVSLAATATDAESGNLSSQVQWTDNGVPIGSGNLLSTLLSLIGVHTYVARVTDPGGLQGSSQVSVTVTLLPSGGGTTVGTLTTTGWKTTTGRQKVDLRWSGLSGANVDVYRNGSKVMATPNDGAETDGIGAKGSATYVYKMCLTGTQSCTPNATVTF
jgi:hypothetical protein